MLESIELNTVCRTRSPSNLIGSWQNTLLTLMEWKAKGGLLATMKEKQELKDDIKRLRPRITY